MSSARARSRVRSLATLAALSVAILAGSAQAPSLRIVSASPTGDLGQLADADQIRIVFSEPMIVLGTVPSTIRPPWISIMPAAAGTFYWSGTKTLIFSQDASTPLPFATTFTVRVDPTATSVAGRALEAPYEFTFATPTVQLLEAQSYRKGGRFDNPAILVLRFNQPVRSDDVLAHSKVASTPHAWTAPQLSPHAREHLRQTDPAGLARFDAKVADVLRVTSLADLVAARLADSWDEVRFPRAPERVVLETTTAPSPDTWLTITLDDRLPSAQGSRTPAAQSTVVRLDPTFFVQRMSCEGPCGVSGFGPPLFMRQGFNPIGLTRSVSLGAFARALTIADVTDRGERPVVATTPVDTLIARHVVDAPSPGQVGFDAQPPARTWRLQLAPDLQAADGQTLDYPWVAFVEQMHYQPFIAFGDSDEAVWEAAGGPLLPVTTRNVISIKQWLAPVAPSEVMARLLELNQKNPDAAPAEAELRRLTALTPDVTQSDGLDIGRLLSAKGTGVMWGVVAPGELLARYPPPPGTAYVVVSPPGPLRVQRRLMQVTNLGITVKDSPQSTLVFVTRLDTGLPVPEARVAIVDTGNRTRWRGTTDRGGVALAPALELRTPSSPALSFMVTAEKEDDFAFVGSDWNVGMFDVNYDLDESVGVLRGSVFTDRGVYKKLEEVRVKAVLRNDTPAGMRLLPADGTLEVVVHDGRGREADRRTVRVNRWSSAEWTWRVPAGAALGQYRIGVFRGGIRPSDEEAPAISGGFLVAAFRRPDFRVDTTLSGDPAVLGSALRGTVDATYLFGAALSARPVRWRLAREPVLRVPDGIREHYPESQFAVGYLPRQDGAGLADAPYEGKTEALDPAGRLNLSLPTTPDRDFAQSYMLEGDVEGPSGQHVANRAALVVHPASIYIAMSRLPTFFDAKTDANVTVAAVDLSGRPVGDTAVTVSLLREQWVSVSAEGRGGGWTRSENQLAEWSVRTSSAATPLPIAIRDGGSYILRAVAGDAAGRRTRTEQRFYALGPGVSSWSSDGNRIDLTPERPTWKPGETARILIHSPWPSATALVTVEREGIRSHRSFTVTSMQDAVEVPIVEADVPNVYVSVLLVKGRTADELAADGTDVGQPSYRVGYTELTVDDSSKRLRVDVAADREDYRPRQPVRVSVAVAAPGGKPVRAEVTLWAMDYGLLSLTDYKTPDVLKQIYSPKALQVMTTDSRQRLMSRRPAAAPLGNEDVINTSTSARGRFALDEMVMVQGARPPETSFTIRQDFRPLVFWLGSATTDAAGRATTTVTLPDSLTSYRIMAVAGDRASQFGFGDREIRVTKPLTLLPAFPRFLGHGDRALFGAVITNSSKEGGQAVVTIQSLAPGTVQFSGVTSQTFDLGPGVSKSVTFDALAAAAGTARVRMTVTLGADTDAFEMPLDVTTPMRVETTAAYGETTGTATETLALPTGVVPGSGGLTVDLASTALVGLGEAARYLDEYPYDCAEQKASRALALLLGSDLGSAFTLSGIKPDAYRAAGATALTDLYSYQCDEGGFSLWPGSCESVSVYLTAYVLHTMKVAETLKVTLDRAAVDSALDYLERELEGPPSQVEWWPVWGASQAYAVKVLAEFGRTPTQDIDRLVGVAERLPIFALSYLADALAATNDKGPRYQDVVRRLTNALRIDADRAHVEEIDDEALGWLWNSNVRATAVVLDGLSRRKDDPTFVSPLVRWLVAARTNGRWDTTHENAMALEALVAYYRAFESEVPRMMTTVKVGSATVGRAAFNGRSTAAQHVEMPMPALLRALTSTTPSTLSISRTGTGRVYYTARVQSLLPELTAAVDRGFQVERRYEPYAKDGLGPPSTTSFSAGDLVRVTVAVTIRGEGRYLALTDPLPAGFEPIEEWFNTTARALAREATRQIGDDDWRSWWRGGAFDHVEKHDDHVVAFATRLGSGRHEFSYLVRATTAGTFGVGGARLEAMYAPELEGRSQAQTITVK